jgi:hypothetical protein
MSMRLAVASAIASALLAAPAPAVAQATNDVRCLLASSVYAKAGKDPKARQLADAAKYFYLGRVHGRLNAAQLKAAMSAEGKKMTGAMAAQAMTACAREVQNAARLAQSVAQQLANKK